jgi:hypothetical protein
MAEIVNLNKARKAQGKAARSAQAAQNRVAFGLTKAQKAKQKAEADKLRRALDDAERER